MTPPKKTILSLYRMHQFWQGEGEGVTNICEVFQQADGLTSSEGALNRGGFLDPAGWFQLGKARGFLQEITHFDYQLGELGGNLEQETKTMFLRKLRKFPKNGEKRVFCVDGSVVPAFLLPEVGAFYGWSLSFSTGAYFCGHYWALMGLAHQTIEHGHLKKMPWKDTFFFSIFFPFRHFEHPFHSSNLQGGSFFSVECSGQLNQN